MMIYERN